jgi:hypothetical protein
MNKTNLFIDLGVFVGYVIVASPGFTGTLIHEWLGVGLALVLFVHLLLYWKWIVGVLSGFFKKLFHVSRLKFIIDLALLVAMTLEIMSGILISRSVLPALGISVGEGSSWKMIHRTIADSLVFLAALHFGLNWKWVLTMLKKYMLDPIASRLKRSPKPAGLPLEAANR